jgi:8-oxo-dGTP pyrophosphatase MutT (NUDIX family)
MTRREISAGCVIYREREDRIEVALTRPKGRDAWALPKGLIEPGETVESAAAREAREETGLEGTIAGKIDTIKYAYTASWEDPPERVFKIVTFYLMEATGGDTSRHDWEIERVEWFGIDDAIRMASYKTEKAVLEKAKALVSAGGRGPSTG